MITKPKNRLSIALIALLSTGVLTAPTSAGTPLKIMDGSKTFEPIDQAPPPVDTTTQVSGGWDFSWQDLGRYHYPHVIPVGNDVKITSDVPHKYIPRRLNHDKPTNDPNNDHIWATGFTAPEYLVEGEWHYIAVHGAVKMPGSTGVAGHHANGNHLKLFIQHPCRSLCGL